MSSFICEHCGTGVIDTSSGYINGCPHYPVEDLTEMSEKMKSEYVDLLAAINIQRESNNG